MDDTPITEITDTMVYCYHHRAPMADAINVIKCNDLIDVCYFWVGDDIDGSLYAQVNNYILMVGFERLLGLSDNGQYILQLAKGIADKRITELGDDGGDDETNQKVVHFFIAAIYGLYLRCYQAPDVVLHVLSDAAAGALPYIDAMISDIVEVCSDCGDPVDYCQGHGELG